MNVGYLFVAVLLELVSLYSALLVSAKLFFHSLGDLQFILLLVGFNHFFCHAALFQCFNMFLEHEFDSTPCITVMSLLLKALQKIPAIAESHSRQLIPLFLKFLGYTDVDTDTLRFSPLNSL